MADKTVVLTVAEAKRALASYVAQHVPDLAVRRELSKRMAKFVGAVVREERRGFKTDRDTLLREINDALHARRELDVEKAHATMPDELDPAIDAIGDVLSDTADRISAAATKVSESVTGAFRAVSRSIESLGKDGPEKDQ